jgi:pSer/pThr/pTyr-binding forkhead associated (FHA) protein
VSSATAIQNSAMSLSVRITDGPHAGESFVLKKESFSLGRGAENDIVLPNDPKLSRNHIRVTFHQDYLTVECLNARNPVLYKENYETKFELRPTERIRAGETEIQFNWDAPAGERTVQVGSDTLAQIHAEKTLVQVTEVSSEQGQQASMPVPMRSGFENPVPPGGPVLNFPNALSPVMPSSNEFGKPHADQKLDFRVATLPSNSGMPEVHYTPTSGGTLHSNKSNALSKSHSKTSSRTLGSVPDSSTRRSPIIIIAVFAVLLIGLLLMPDNEKKPRKSNIKDTDQIKKELGQSAEAVEQYMKEKRLLEDGRMDRQYESAQSYYVKGFRDYRQGQYGRAIMSFQAALSFDPNHMLARKYLNQSIKKHAELVQFNLDQARRYRQKNNFRLCRSAAQQVMIMRRDQNDPQYKDAKGLYDECDTLSKGRF